MRAKLSFVLVGALGALVSAACGTGAAGKAVKPDAPKVTSVLKSIDCRAPGEEGEPLVVDWPTEQRGDLETAMKGGIAVVAYDCKTVKVLSDCQGEGKYNFTGITMQEEVIRMEDADEIALTLSNGAALGAKLSAELERGTTLDVAFAMVGKRRTSSPTLAKADLRGGSKCNEATHFVRGANVGAFAMKTGSKGSVSTAAEILGQGVRAASSSSQINETSAGQIADCKTADPDGPSPPKQCGSPIRVLLLSIGATARVDGVVTSTCPKGAVRAGGKCVPEGRDVVHLCRENDVADCQKQCDRGDLPSCVNVGFSFERAAGAARDDKRALMAYKKACDGRFMRGCAGLGSMLFYGQGVDVDYATAKTAFENACNAGDARGCNGLGNVYRKGKGATKSMATAVKNYDRACKLGYVGGCKHVGDIYANGKDVPKDDARAMDAFQAGCRGGDESACLWQASLLAEGRGGAKNPGLAQQLVTRAMGTLEKECKGMENLSCKTLAETYQYGFAGVRKDIKTAVTYYDAACSAGLGDACGDLGDLLTKGEAPLAKNAARAKTYYEQACKLDDDDSCAKAGIKPGAKGTPAPPPTGGKPVPIKGPTGGKSPPPKGGKKR